MDNMDKFLSKAKRVDNGEWVIGYAFPTTQNKGKEPYCVIVEQQECIDNIEFMCWIEDFPQYRVDPSTLCQCKGLKDLKDVLVYDGDIISIDYEEESQACEGATDTIPYLFKVWTDEKTGILYLREFVYVYVEDDKEIMDYLEDYNMADMCNDGIVDGTIIRNIHDKEVK